MKEVNDSINMNENINTPINTNEEVEKQLTRQRKYKDMSVSEVFNTVYDINDWSSPESVSGQGSTLEFTQNTRRELPGICKKYGIKRVLDVACGDFNWMKEIVHHFDYYRGTDIVERIINSNIKKYYVKNKVEFEVNNVINDFNTYNIKYDAIIAKDLFVHFPTRTVIKTLKLFKGSGIKYLFLTHFSSVKSNRDISSFGMWRPINFRLEPFLFENPLEIIEEPNEVYNFLGKNRNDKTLSLWELKHTV